MAYTIRPKYDTAAAYAALNRVYLAGTLLAEVGLDDVVRLKVADGVTAYNSLAYVDNGAGSLFGFGNIAVSGQTTVAADQVNDTFTLVGSNGITITTHAPSDTITLTPSYGTLASTVCEGNDARLSNARTPSAHSSSHQAGGLDGIKLDDLVAPDDNTDLNATTSAHGLLPKLSGTSTQYLSGAGTWTIPAGGGGGGNAFGTISVPNQTSVVADAPADTATLVGANGIAVTTTPASSIVTFSPTYGTSATTICQGNDPRLNGIRIASITDYGAVQGVDNTTAIQNALNANSALFIPPGDWRVTATLTIDHKIELFGVSAEPYRHNLDGTRGPGSWLHFDHTGIGIRVVWGTSEEDQISGLVLRDFGTVRTQPSPGSGWAPTAYDFDITMERADCSIYRLMLWNANKGINLLQPGNGLSRITIDGLRGHCMTIGIQISAAYDVCRISNVHFWPFWNVNDNVRIWMQTNFRALVLWRCDGLMVDNFFAIWYAVGIQVEPSSFGDFNRGQFTNCTFDLGNIGFQINTGTGTSPTLSPSFQFSNLIIYSDPRINSVSVQIRGNNAVVDMVNAELRQNPYNAIQLQGTGNILTLTNTRIGYWNLNNTSAPAISILSGNAVNFGSKPVFFGSGSAPRIANSGSTLNYQDDQFYFDSSGGAPFFNFDANDYMVFDRVNNRFEWYIGGVRRAYVDTTGFHNG